MQFLGLCIRLVARWGNDGFTCRVLGIKVENAVQLAAGGIFTWHVAGCVSRMDNDQAFASAPT